ncbi:MAG: 1,4-dihydroxy-2-naphthoate octaprenyltransferase [Prevotellaceae bacterium]|jgi:1,4-dihydroxy-2-naphthoate octaprenyltransferase|nr:1,4-dihydroxy-2-naphthoate octaprenyltransferase [Prevotellaceae bacterium]
MTGTTEVMTGTTEVKTGSLRAWFLAARPKTLTGAVIPVMCGTALAYSDGQCHIVSALLCALFAGSMQIAANFINDLFDYLKGSDRADRLGPERACAQGWITPSDMKRGIVWTLLFACSAGMGVLLYARPRLPYGGGELIVLGGVCVLFAFLYTTYLSYRGWGDLLVILFFGFVPVGGTYYVQACTLNGNVWLLSLICGLLIDTLLIINNYRDREQDKLSGKRTLIVRLGGQFGLYLYLMLGVVVLLLSWGLLINGKLNGISYAIIFLTYSMLHLHTWFRMKQIHSGKALNRILGATSRNMLLMGILLSAGLAFTAQGA